MCNNCSCNLVNPARKVLCIFLVILYAGSTQLIAESTARQRPIMLPWPLLLIAGIVGLRRGVRRLLWRILITIRVVTLWHRHAGIAGLGGCARVGSRRVGWGGVGGLGS